MTGQQLRESLRAGRRVYGTCLTNPSPWTVDAYTQLDYAFIDNEHGPHGRETIMTLCQVFKARGIVPVVRIPVADPTLACMALDGSGPVDQTEDGICANVITTAAVNLVLPGIDWERLVRT